MKKLLVSLMAITIVSSASTAVVACGPITNAKLLARNVNTEVFRGTFKFPMTSWSTGSTMQNEDAIILAQLQDTLITPNAYDQFEGSLAQWWGHDEKSVEWYFNVRDEAKWAGLKDKSTNSYEEKGQIGGKGFYDAFRFVLNPNNQSETTGSWSTIIAEGNEIVEFIEKLMKEYPEYFSNSKEQGTEGNSVTHVRTTKAIDSAIMFYNAAYGHWLDEGNNRENEWASEEKAAFDWKKEFGDASGKISQATVNTIVNNSKLGTKEYEAYVLETMTKGGIIKATPIIDGKTEKTMVKVGDAEEGYNLTMRLQKPAPYFESLAGFLSLAPMPPIAVDYGVGSSNSSYKYGESYENIWSSGGYVVDEYGPSTVISLKTNPYYFNKDKTFIKKQIYSFVGNVDVSKPRLFFEAGDVSEVAISPTDFSGWTKYVGEDFNNPVFEGAHDIKKPNTNSFFLLYNYNYETGDSTIADSSLALSQNTVRAYLAYLMERTQLAKYYSDAMDTKDNNVDQSGNQISRLLKNMYTGAGFATYQNEENETVDYTQHVENLYIDKMKEAAEKIQPGIGEDEDKFNLTYNFSKNIADGYDAFRRNDVLALNAMELAGDNNIVGDEFKAVVKKQNDEIQAAGSTEAAIEQGLYTKYEAEKIAIFQKQVRSDIKRVTGKETVTLKMLTNGNNSSTVNKALLNMTGSFNVVANNPIQIEEVKSTDSANFITLRTKGAYDLMTGGWTPDYNDPFNFLHTLIFGGEYGNYQRFSKYFKIAETKEKSLSLVPTEYLEKSGKAEFYQDLQNSLQAYTNEVMSADLIGEYKRRYDSFAQAEYNVIFNSNMILPLYVPTGATTMYLSYTNPFTRAAFPSGSSQYRLFGAQMTSSLMDKETYKREKELYEAKDPKYASPLWEYSKNSGKLAEKA
ncbi:oligopeptide ABC transporter substrate-binding protein OppA [Mesoplasma seiffertii]|uniref:oligopeptide ABC transporter substrate-binding protein OppA n=1 Tax=Mesoplasma seiffertii TaxID=28224 RepID=UPI00047868AC|nr:oligopeptide ABC transporter substrate-binding protein OppA [Mesoplasma seiffertii]